MALKMDLKGIFIFDIYDILLQIATWTVDRGQLSQYLGFFEKIKIKIKKILKQV
jgi:hypothetical protein